MSLEDNASLQDDLSFLKKLAQDGRGKPAPVALFLAGWGLLYGIAELAQWGLMRLEQAGLVGHEVQRQIVPLWYLVHPLTLLLLVVSLVQTFRPREGASRVNRIAAIGWAAAFAGVVVMVTCELLFGRIRNDYSALMLLPCMLLVLWGFAWSVSAVATGQHWLHAVSAGSFVAAVAWALALLYASPDILLLTALCYLLLAFVPGVILMRRG